MAVHQQGIFLITPSSGEDSPFVLYPGDKAMLPGIANVRLTATLCPSTAAHVVAVDGLVQVPCPHEDGGGQHLVYIKRCDETYPDYYRLAVEGEPPTDVDEVVKGEAIAVYTQGVTIRWTVVAIG